MISNQDFFDQPISVILAEVWLLVVLILGILISGIETLKIVMAMFTAVSIVKLIMYFIIEPRLNK
jgi:hypothetical protein